MGFITSLATTIPGLCFPASTHSNPSGARFPSRALSGEFCRTVLSDEDTAMKFDGEMHIEREIARWGTRDLILLDPFAIWLSPADQARRDRYGRIFDTLIQRGAKAPSLILFWTWGRRHQREAIDDLAGAARDGVENGYHGLRAKLHDAGLAFVRVKWCWKQWFAMWVLVPGLPPVGLTELERELQARCQLITALWAQCGHARPDLEVKVEGY